MSNDDDLDDLDPGPVPGPDAEPTAAERARARSFAELVDKVVAGRAPAAMSAEDRALVEVATVIRTAHGNLELPAARRSALVEQALRGAVEGRSASPVPTAKLADIVPLASRRRLPAAPWIVAAVSTAVAVAAVLALMLSPPPARPPAERPVAELPTTLRSRPADADVGVIPQERAGDASARLDAIFADRLDGFRALSLEPSRRGGR